MRFMPWIVGIALITAAWAATLIAPAPTAWRTPYVVPITLGETQSSGNAMVTVHDVYFTDEIVDPSPEGRWTGSANFLVIDLSAQLNDDETRGGLTSRTAMVNGKEYWPTERVTAQLATLSVAMSTHGVLVYELPPELRDGTMTVLLGNGDAKQAGQVVQLEIDLSQLATRASVTLEKPTWEPAR